MIDPVLHFERQLGLSLDDKELLRRALTHRSRSRDNNERLEFLGDSVLGLVVTEWLYHRFPEISEGKLSRMRSVVVRKDSLAAVARSLGLADAVLLGEGELKSGGFNRESILADALEALIGAIYTDQGMEAARKFVLTRFDRRLGSLHPEDVYKDPKTRLQELLQKRGGNVPVYEVVQVEGEPHCQTFRVACTIAGAAQSFVATGKNRRTAEQAAAEKAYTALNQ